VYRFIRRRSRRRTATASGDLLGIIQKLDYVKSLGVDATGSIRGLIRPFSDAGLRHPQLLQIAPRYGSNDDARRLLPRRTTRPESRSITSSPTPPLTIRGSVASCEQKQVPIQTGTLVGQRLENESGNPVGHGYGHRNGNS